MQGKASDICAVLGVIKPDATAAGTVVSGWISAKNFHRFMAVIQAGDLGASATVDAKLRQATSAAGAGAKDVPARAITQLTQAGTDSNKQAVINLNPQALDVEGGFSFFELSVTVATATSELAGIVLGLMPRSGPASDFDASTVDEVVG